MNRSLTIYFPSGWAVDRRQQVCKEWAKALKGYAWAFSHSRGEVWF